MNELLERELARFEREHPRSAELARRARNSLLAGVPTSEEALWVGEELTRRFGLPRWQLPLTATDANR